VNNAFSLYSIRRVQPITHYGSNRALSGERSLKRLS
jgi:hypothetical protein